MRIKLIMFSILFLSVFCFFSCKTSDNNIKVEVLGKNDTKAFKMVHKLTGVHSFPYKTSYRAYYVFFKHDGKIMKREIDKKLFDSIQIGDSVKVNINSNK